MDSHSLAAKLHRVTGQLTETHQTPARELERFEETLAEHLRANPNLTIRGTAHPHDILESMTDAPPLSDRLVKVIERAKPRARVSEAPSARIFRRETPFRSNLLGTSVPDWATGRAPAASFGPFVDEHGFSVWFDLFDAVTLTTFAIGGRPVLRAPIRGTVAAASSYRIEPGSVWVASNLIARNGPPPGFYTGLRVKGGSIELSSLPVVANGQIHLDLHAQAAIHFDLDQPAAPHDPQAAGGDAVALEIYLPKSMDLRLEPQTSTVAGGDASCTVFGCTTDFSQSGDQPVWVQLFNSILIPYAARTRTETPDRFEVMASDSELCRFDGGAAIDPGGTGWFLPAVQADPLTLGAAAGIGALRLTLAKGLSAAWKDLAVARTTLVKPGIIVEPGLITVIDLDAANPNGRVRWRLWRNATTPHASEIELTFGKLFAFGFMSSADNSELVVAFCSHACRLDRPVDANGRPFTIQSSDAFLELQQNGERFQVRLLDPALVEAAFVPSRARSVALRNALFVVGEPQALFLAGDLENARIVAGLLVLTHDIHGYLPTLPDPYVASYTSYLREFTEQWPQALSGFVKWPDRSPLPEDAEDPADPRAFVYYKLTPRPPQLAAADRRTFLRGVPVFDANLMPDRVGSTTVIPPTASFATLESLAYTPPDPTTLARAARGYESREVQRAIADLETSPLLAHIPDKVVHVRRLLEQSVRGQTRELPAATIDLRQRDDRMLPPEQFFRQEPVMLLDVSTRADQMGVAVGPALVIDRNDQGNVHLRRADAFPQLPIGDDVRVPLQIMNMDVVTLATHARAVTLPQISWEPFWNIPIPIEGNVDPADTVAATPGLILHPFDGFPTRILSESPYPVPIAPLPVARHFLQEYHDARTPRHLHSSFTLPFGMIAQASFRIELTNPPERNARVDFNVPQFKGLRGGLQLKVRAPQTSTPDTISAYFPGWTFQADALRWNLFNWPLTGSTLGSAVQRIFNKRFQPGGARPAVPLERIELSGYGASIFSNWLDATSTIADVSQTQFDVVVGRTAHEVVQVRSILYPFGVHVVRTITLLRSNNGYVFRSDSGWKAESDGFYDFDYTIEAEGLAPVVINTPYEIHAQPVKGVSRVREIRDFPDGGTFTSAFKINDPDLPPGVLGLWPLGWPKLNSKVTTPDHTLNVRMQSVVFDADVHLDNVVVGGTETGGDFIVPSRRMHGYVQLEPASILVPPHVFAALLNFQNGSLGGPVDCTIDIAKSNQRMRVSRVDVNPATNAAGRHVFVSAARGSLVLPPDGSWSVVKQQTSTGDVTPLAPQEIVPLIKPNASPHYVVAHPADVHVPASTTHYGVLQSTGTQKLLFDVPHFAPGDPTLRSVQTYFADAYKLLNSKGVFPNVANALGLTAGERELEILGEGALRMIERTLDVPSLLPPGYEYAFVDEPGVLRIYARYGAPQLPGALALGIDSAATPDKRWGAALGNLRVLVDLGPFKEVMWVHGNFNARSGVQTKYDKPQLEFGKDLQPVVDILRVLALLSGDDFDRGMDVGMSNSADNWEYKFNCSKEIPVIKFPSPQQLTVNPNPPLKLEAGLKVGFYFNEVLSIPTDLKQVVPGCGAYVEFYGRLQVQCFTLAIASVYGVGQVTLGIAADSKAGITLRMKFGFGAEVVVGLPVVLNVSVLYMIEVEITIAEDKLHVAGLVLIRGSAEICGGLIGITIQIEAGGAIERGGADDATSIVAQVTFSIDVCVLWVIDIDVTETWEEQRQIA